MAASEQEPLAWRTVYGIALVLVLGFFLFSLREIFNPFLLFLLLTFLLSPFSGRRTHLLMVLAAALLTLIWLLQITGFLLTPFLLAVVFAYVLHPLVERVQGPRISRALAIALLALPLLGLLALTVFVGIPALSGQIAQLIERLPALIGSAVEWVERARVDLARRDFLYLDEEVLLARLRGIRPEAVIEYLQAHQAELAQRIWRGVLGAGRGLSSVLSLLSYVFLTPILTFYLLRDYDRVTDQLVALTPRSRKSEILSFAREYDTLLSRYLRGQLVAAAIIGVLTGLLFWVVGFPNALLLGVVAGVFNLVPYLGLIVSLIPALLIALFSGAVLLSLGKIALVFAIVQTLDNTVVSPRIVGESVGLHPVWVILALAVAGFFWGFTGLLLAIPLAVLVKLLLIRALERYQRSELFHGMNVPAE